MRKEIVEFRIPDVNYQLVTGYQYISQKSVRIKKKKLKNAERNCRISHILCELSN